MKYLRIELDETELEPGAELTGRAEWDLVSDHADLLSISLLWHTEGKGTEDSETVDQIEIRSPAISGSQTFSFQLPILPWSFSGQIISVIWNVEASLEKTELVSHNLFTMAPGGQEVLLQTVDDS